VTHVKAVGTSGVEVRVADGTVYTAESLVVASGAWTNDVRIKSHFDRVFTPTLSSPTHHNTTKVLKHVGSHIPLLISQEQVTYFATPHVKDFTPERFPVWIGYGFPGVACYYGNLFLLLF